MGKQVFLIALLIQTMACSLGDTIVQVTPYCGDGIVNNSEQCDDGNLRWNDRCTLMCMINTGQENEPNDTASQATPFFIKAISFAVTGSIEYDDVDYFSFEIPISESAYILTAEVRDGFYGSRCIDGEINSLLVLHDRENIEIARDTSSGENNCSKLSVLLSTPGQFYMELRSGADYYQFQPFDYSLHITYGVLSGDFETEPNEKPSEASLLESGKIKSGYMLSGSIDFYYFVVPPNTNPAIVTIDVLDGFLGRKCIDEEVHGGLILYDQKSNVILEGIAREGSCESIRAFGLSPGKYFLKFYSSYQFDYSLKLQIEAVSNSEKEPNGKISTANVYADLKDGSGIVYGFIWPVGDEDYYHIYVPATGLTAIDIIDGRGDEKCIDGAMDSYVRVYNSVGDMVASDDDSGEGRCSHVAIETLAMGNYYIRVKEGYSDELMSYGLKIY